MVLLLVGIVLGCAALVWIWKVPVKKLVNAMRKSGSSSFEAYAVVILLMVGIAFTIYMIAKVV